MKNKALKILNLIFALFLAVFSISYVFAWFADGTKVPLNINGQASAYFAYGDGLSEETAFGITEPIHLYNLSWLQNSGKFDDNTYYFEINENLEGALDMSGYWLAPIGNFEHPFKGVFNGSGKTIKGLQVTTNKSLLQSNDPAKDFPYLFSNAVGFFGKTGSSAQIRNFILDNPKVEVEAGDEMYCRTTETGTDGQVVDTKVVGFAVGEDNGSTTDGTTTTAAISNIGVIGGVLSVQRADYQTKNAIIGSTTLQGSTDGDTTSGNTGYFDPTEMYNAFSSNSSIIKDEEFVGQNFIVSDSSNKLSLGAFSFATQRSSDTPVSIDIDYKKYIDFDSYQVSAGSSEATPSYINYLYNVGDKNDQTAITGADENFSTYENDIKTVNSYIVPASGWTDERESGTFEYALYVSGASQDENTTFNVYTENGTSTGKNVTLSNARTIKMDINKMEKGNPSILILVSANNERTLTFAEYSVKDSSGNTVKYADYAQIASDTKNDNGTAYTFTVGSGNSNLTIIYQDLPNKTASYGLSFSGSVRLYFMRVVGVAGTDTDPAEGSLDSIDFIAEGDTMVYSNGTVTFNYVETGTLIGLSGNGASIIIGFIREATTVGEGDSATTTYTFSVTYSAVATTEPGSTYSPNPTVSNVVTVGENESFTGSEDSLFPGSLSS